MVRRIWRGPPGEHGKVRFGHGCSRGEVNLRPAAREQTLDGYCVGHFFGGHNVSVALGFCQGLGTPQPKIQKPMAQRWPHCQEQEHLLCVNREFSLSLSSSFAIVSIFKIENQYRHKQIQNFGFGIGCEVYQIQCNNVRLRCNIVVWKMENKTIVSVIRLTCLTRYSFVVGLQFCPESCLGGDCDAIQYRAVWITIARVFPGFTGGHSTWALELLQVQFLWALLGMILISIDSVIISTILLVEKTFFRQRKFWKHSDIFFFVLEHLPGIRKQVAY